MSDLPGQGSTDMAAPALVFVGLGAMGEPMATRLARSGARITVCDARDDHAASVASTVGATSVPVAGLTSAVRETSLVVLMLPDTSAVTAVLEGPDGVLAALPRDAVVLDMGSSQPATTIRLAEAATKAGVGYADAPVSGGVPKALTGELSIMVGATDQIFGTVRPTLEVLGSGITHVGPVGSGHAMKALNNLLSAIGLAAASEVLAIGANFGLAPQVMLDVLNGSTGGNHATKVKMTQYVLSRRFDSGFALDLMVKDLRTALDLAHETSTPVPLSATCLEEWAAAGRTLPPHADHTEIAAYVEARARIELR